MKTILVLVALAVTAVHGGGKLKMASKHLMVNAAFGLTGSEFEKKEEFTILLIGSSGRTKLGEIKSDTAGKFATTVTIPAGTKAGSYRLVLEASDDDEAASADVMVMANDGMAVGAEEHDTTRHEAMDMPSHEPLTLERARSPLVLGGALTTIVLALVLGSVLLRCNSQA
ncbi:MAG: hypothetical protein EXR93_09390 [Gemmatimonadetes bacterium]|nr:hypothetical protein [Gemmatimonadota bacterium]